MVHDLEPEASGAWARRRVETTARVLDAALELLARDGYDGLTMHALARALGYTVGALYRYFPSREALFVAAQARVLGELRAALAADEARLVAVSSRWGAEVRALASLLVLARAYADFAAARPAAWHLLAVSVGDPRELVSAGEGAEMVAAVGELMAWCAARFDAARAAEALDAAGEGASVRQAVMYWSAVHGALQLRKLARFGLPGVEAGALVDDAAQTLLRGCGADPARVREAARRVDRLRGAEP
jgi:AcrR family transcriptional regulator